MDLSALLQLALQFHVPWWSMRYLPPNDLRLPCYGMTNTAAGGTSIHLARREIGQCRVFRMTIRRLSCMFWWAACERHPPDRSLEEAIKLSNLDVIINLRCIERTRPFIREQIYLKELWCNIGKWFGNRIHITLQLCLTFGACWWKNNHCPLKLFNSGLSITSRH